MKKNKKIVAIIPIKSVSKRVKGKNFKIVNGKPLYRYLLDKLKFCNFDDVYVDSDSHEIEKYCKKIGYHYLKRKSVLARDSANGNDLINYHSSIIRADIYFQVSDFEGFGLSLLEAAYHSLPIVSTDVGLIGEILKDNKSVFVVEQDISQSVQALNRLIQDENLRTSLGQKASKASLYNQIDASF